jgi:hypothetical protein
MLADVLASTGLVGRALEHFNQHSLPPEARVRLGDFLVERAGKAHGTRVFATKLVWYQLDLFLTRLKALRGAHRLTERAAHRCLLP